ncbi:hypothetical protein QQF64_006616 [Cirrhinus molitorella]|uniref:Uncharacterized protein n=1 Tax=Cirrhinus molitorella TaxID=172907 RepID=A0ABR3M8D2_9TELE
MPHQFNIPLATMPEVEEFEEWLKDSRNAQAKQNMHSTGPHPEQSWTRSGTHMGRISIKEPTSGRLLLARPNASCPDCPVCPAIKDLVASLSLSSGETFPPSASVRRRCLRIRHCWVGSTNFVPCMIGQQW